MLRVDQAYEFAEVVQGFGIEAYAFEFLVDLLDAFLERFVLDCCVLPVLWEVVACERLLVFLSELHLERRIVECSGTLEEARLGISWFYR